MNTIHSEVEERIHDIFTKIAEGDKLQSGDIEPLEQERLDEAIKTIAEVIHNWREQNHKRRNFSITIEATDEADADNLKKRIGLFLKELDNGDYLGRQIKIIVED